MNTFNRHDRVRSLISEFAAKFIREEANTNPLITVTGVQIANDYRKATILITTVPEGDGPEQNALTFLKRHAGEFRSQLKKKSDFKIIPHIDFALDVGERHRQHIDEVARNIERGKES
jgi:ribosome-binding factor A